MPLPVVAYRRIIKFYISYGYILSHCRGDSLGSAMTSVLELSHGKEYESIHEQRIMSSEFSTISKR